MYIKSPVLSKKSKFLFSHLFLQVLFENPYKTVNLTNCIKITSRRMCKTIGKMHMSDMLVIALIIIQHLLSVLFTNQHALMRNK